MLKNHSLHVVFFSYIVYTFAHFHSFARYMHLFIFCTSFQMAWKGVCAVCAVLLKPFFSINPALTSFSLASVAFFLCLRHTHRCSETSLKYIDCKHQPPAPPHWLLMGMKMHSRVWVLSLHTHTGIRHQAPELYMEDEERVPRRHQRGQTTTKPDT